MRIFIIQILILVALVAQAQRPNNNTPNNHPNGPCFNCPQPMSEVDFSQALSYIQKESFDDNKMGVAKRIVDGNYMLSAQVKQVVDEFSFSASKLEIAKYAYAKTYDQKNYYVVNDAFDFPSDKKTLNNWLGTQPINDYSSNNHHHNSYNYPVAMSNEDFAPALKQIKKESFDDSRMAMAKRVVDGNYLLAAQVKEITKQFAFSASKLEIAKYAYPKTFDQKNYFVVNDAFDFPSDKKTLNNWLSNQPINDYTIHHHEPIDNNNPNGLNDNPNINNNNSNSTPNNNNSNNNPNNNNPNNNNNNNPNNNPNNNLSGNSNVRPNDNNNNNSNNNPNTPPVPTAMNNGDFLNFKAQLVTKSTDRQKVQLVEQMTQQSYWSVQQVKEMMQLLSFEDERVNLAKAAYFKTLDNALYTQVLDLLFDNNHKINLQQFIQQNQGGR